MNTPSLRIAVAIGLAASAALAFAAAPLTSFPTRDPNMPGYVTAKVISAPGNPQADVDGNFIIGPDYVAAPEYSQHDNVLQGNAYVFTLGSADSKIYPGIARETGTFGNP